MLTRLRLKDECGITLFGLIVLTVTLILNVSILFIGLAMTVSRISCNQMIEARPDVVMEWHWATGCIVTDPDQSVVVSR